MKISKKLICLTLSLVLLITGITFIPTKTDAAALPKLNVSFWVSNMDGYVWVTTESYCPENLYNFYECGVAKITVDRIYGNTKKNIATITSKATLKKVWLTWKDTNVASGKTYDYVIKCYNSKGKLIYGKTERIMYLCKPTNIKVSGITKNKATISCSKLNVSGLKYNIRYWEQGKVKDTVCEKKATANTIKLTGLKKGTTYEFFIYYSVGAYQSVSSKKVTFKTAKK